ncbi:hypothetical protein LOTGIDRAFT_168807 [Lottia gigantea]|uniref:Uncharacterized protein n=1 Tax=Lottia gigantea TaxID=225164 RepID=V3ZJF8_LOTGI|nr:hypothetical protein LOTGIDRAFT_168807 [Lottia gigantea]ESO84362.1 hypothetical protein LOTGIDRAFT_168807 [Lottia gigantea]
MFLLNKLRAKAESFDSLTKPKTVVTEREIYEYLSQENGMIRLKRAFDKSNGELSPELNFYFENYANQSSAKAIFFVSSLYAYNKNKKLIPPNLPKKEQFKTIIKNSLKDSVLISVRYFSLLALSFGITETIGVYRNKTSPLEFVFVCGLMSGIVSGLQYEAKPPELPKVIANKMQVPLKPITRMVAIRNGILNGAFMGLLFGVMFTYVAGITGTSQENRHFWNVQTKLREQKEKELALNLGAARNEELL